MTLMGGMLKKSLLAAYGKVGAPNFVEGKHEYLPIPQDEMDANPNLTQIEGWR